MRILEDLGLDTDDPDIIDVGQEHIARVMYSDSSHTNISGLILVHPHKKNPEQICQGFADVGPGEWEVVVKDPLTVHPSFVCNDCGDHGIIRDGKWREAHFEAPHKRHMMPQWLRYSMGFFCSTKEEVEHVYRRPIPEQGYLSVMDLVLMNQWDKIAEWLDRMYYIHSSR